VFGANPPPKRFPRSKSGNPGPFEAPPAKPPPSTDANPTFDLWVNYYVQLVGSALERLNGLQFDLTQANEPATANSMSDELGQLADALNVGSPAFPTNAPQLRWPLAGSYILNQNAEPTGFDTFIVDLYFENEPTYRMVVNCSIAVTAEPPGTIAPESGTSSYIATSSK
jgi:hypothetical protein